MNQVNMALVLSIIVSTLSIIIAAFLAYELTHSSAKQGFASALCFQAPSSISFPGQRTGDYLFEGGNLYFVLDPKKKKALTIGRNVDADICVSSVMVSRNHARLSWNDQRWFLEDLGSANGTRVNGLPVTSPVCLRNGDVICLNDVEMTYQERVKLGSPHDI